MEVELIDCKDVKNNYFGIEYKNQNVNLNPNFIKWYNNTKKYIDQENKKRGKPKSHADNRLLVISFCNNCKSYVICSAEYEFSFVQCNICQSKFCIGCSREMLSNDDESLCLKGYFKLLYVRCIYRRAGKLASSDILNIIFTVICILLSPCYFGYISHTIGLQVHQNPNGSYNDYTLEYFEIIAVYSILRGILMFPYIILFLPFTLCLLIPSFLSPIYFFRLIALYTSMIDPMDIKLEIDTY